MAFSVSEPLQQHYASYYDGPSEWRLLGAEDKAANVVALCAAIPHGSVLEIGAGEGALLARLAELDFAHDLHALDVSPSAVEATRQRAIPRVTSADVFDGYQVPYEDGCFDLAVLSHVLEHVEHPRRLLAEAARVARHVVLEVPLEDTWRSPREWVPDSLGHINFYSPASLRRLVRTTGLSVLGQRISHPGRACYAYRLGAAGPLAWWLKDTALRIAPGLATRLATYHGSILCQRQRN